jgi:hypothetical protein
VLASRQAITLYQPEHCKPVAPHDLDKANSSHLAQYVSILL